MRVNHAGEIAAQALYHGQALFARIDATRELLANAAREERDHLAWCAERLDELGGRTSLLDPLWYAGSFGIGVLAGRFAPTPRASASFARRSGKSKRILRDHLATVCPQRDAKSAAILSRMAEDEAHHGTTAALAGRRRAARRDPRLHARSAARSCVESH